LILGDETKVESPTRENINILKKQGQNKQQFKLIFTMFIQAYKFHIKQKNPSCVFFLSYIKNQDKIKLCVCVCVCVWSERIQKKHFVEKNRILIGELKSIIW
jgi:hypothetical protein